MVGIASVIGDGGIRVPYSRAGYLGCHSRVGKRMVDEFARTLIDIRIGVRVVAKQLLFVASILDHGNTILVHLCIEVAHNEDVRVFDFGGVQTAHQPRGIIHTLGL